MPLTPDQQVAEEYAMQKAGKTPAEIAAFHNANLPSGYSVTGGGQLQTNPIVNPDVRQLPSQGSLSAFQDVLKQLSYNTLQQNKPSVADVINQYMDKGLSLVNPSAIQNAYTQQADLYARPIGDIYQSTMNAMQEVEKTKQEKFNTIAQDIFKSAPGFISSLTGEEFDQFKNLQFSPEMQVKLQAAQQAANQQDNKFQFVPTTENQQGGSFDPQTGKFTAYGGGAPSQETTSQVFNASVDQLANAIKKVESGGDYNAKGGSGENGAYQFMPATWQGWSQEYANQVLNKSVSQLPLTPTNQDAVAKFKIQQWLNQGLTPQQIAAKWNSGSEVGWETKKGVNAQGVSYDVPAYVNKVLGALGSQVKQEGITSDGYDVSKFDQKFYNSSMGQKVLNNEQQYQTNFLTQPVVRDFITTQTKAASVNKIINMGVGGPGDLAVIFEFMKALDPNSVVRETEYESAAKSGNLFKGIFAKFNGYLKEEGGFLPDNVKQSFLQIINAKNKVNEQAYNQIRDQFRKTAYEQGLNPNHVAPDLVVKQDVAQNTPNTMKVGNDTYVLQPNGKYIKQ